MDRERSSSRLLLAGVVLVLAVAAAYTPIVRNGFIDYDDPDYITHNPHVRAGLSAETAIWAFLTGHRSNWHPLTWLSHALDVTLFDLEPSGHHLHSVALHALGAVLLMLALVRMTGRLARSAAVAAFFALHPLRVESVAWAAERKDVLSGAFFMAILVAYARHAKQPTAGSRLLVAGLLALGLMAKPMLVTVPFVLLLLDRWPLRRWGVGDGGGWRSFMPPRRAWIEKAPLFALAAASSVVTFLVQRRGGAVVDLEVVPFGARAANALVAYATYLGRSVWPENLAVLYPITGVPPAPSIALAGATLLVLSAAAVGLARKAPYVLTGWLWYIGMLVPVVGLVQVGVQSSADRYTYLPSIGLAVAVVWGSADALASWRHRRVALAAAAVLALALCAGATWRQVGFWRDSVTLFEHTLSVAPANPVIHNNLGGTLLAAGRVDDAIVHLERARVLRPHYAEALSNLGVAIQGKGRIGEAIDLYREAIRAKPTHLQAWLNLGNMLEATGDIDGAIAAFAEALRLDPTEPAAAARLAALREGKTTAAPGGAARTRYEAGNRLRDERRFAEAERAYRDAIRLDPGFAEAHNNLASVLGRQGRTEEAIAALARALEIAPGLTAARVNLGIALAMTGDLDGAARELAEALRQDPRDATAHGNLAAVLARQGKTAEAIAHYEDALRLNPDDAAARRGLEDLRRGTDRRTAPEPL